MNQSTLTLRVSDKRLVAESITVLELSAPAGGELPPFTAGAHLQIHLPGGLNRSYSICNDPVERHRFQLAVQLDPDSRGGSLAVHQALSVGDTIRVSGPHNLFELDESAPHTVLLAGGIGITPILAMARRLHGIGLSWQLHYAVRTKARAVFLEELEVGPLAVSTRLHFDDGPAADRLDVKAMLAAAPTNSHLYVCGPTGLIDHALSTARLNGWAEKRLHSERFSAVPVAAVGNRAFQVVLARSGLTLSVPADRTVMSVVLGAGIDLPVSCEQGICGTCVTEVLEGQPDHRDQCLDDSLRERCFTPCCSRALGESLTLDL